MAWRRRPGLFTEPADQLALPGATGKPEQITPDFGLDAAVPGADL